MSEGRCLDWQVEWRVVPGESLLACRESFFGCEAEKRGGLVEELCGRHVGQIAASVGKYVVSSYHFRPL